MSSPNTPPDFYREAKPFINKVKTFEPLSVVLIAIEKLHWVHRRKNIGEWQGWTPWELLLLIKWTFALAPHTHSSKKCDLKGLSSLVNKIKALEGPSSRVLRKQDPHGINKFLRIVAFQQFWLQNASLAHSDIGRSIILFTRLNDSYHLAQKFEAATGITLISFIQLNVCTWARFLSDERKGFVDRSWFSSIERYFPNGTIDKYLELLSLDFQEAVEFSKKSYQLRGLHLQLTEQSPFKLKPLLRVGDKYLCYYPQLYNYFFNYSVYDFMKKTDSNAFSPSLGVRMEKYIDLNLREMKMKYITERDLKKILQESDPKIDFVLPFNNFNILIESKGVELNQLATVNPDPNLFERALEDSITKALKQAIFVADKIKNQNIPGVNSVPPYIFIVSYKELYLGRGHNIWEEVFKKATAEFCTANGISEDTIDPSKIYFASIDDLDCFFSIITNKNEDEIKAMLDTFSSDNQHPSTAKFVFADHLTPFLKGVSPLPHVFDESRKLLEDMDKFLK